MVRKYLQLISIFWVFVSFFSFAYAGENLINNPSAEIGTVSPDNWAAYNAAWGNVAHTGVKSLQLNTTSQVAYWISTPVNVTAEQKYNFVFWVYGNCSSNFAVLLNWYSDYEGNTLITQKTFTILAGEYCEWLCVNETVISPSDVKTARVVADSLEGTGVLWFDDFALVPIMGEESMPMQWFREFFYGSAKWFSFVIVFAIIITVTSFFPYAGVLFMPLTIFLGFDYLRNVSVSSDFMWGALMMIFAAIYILVMLIMKMKAKN